MPPRDLRRVSNHSFRAGGATDWSIGGMGDEFIKQQGGWSGPTYRIYVRPMAHHAFRTAARMLDASRAILGTFFPFVV